MKTAHGDLLSLAQQGDFDVIIHGCNCFNTMGAGIANSIRHKFPAAYHADCQTRKGNPDKMGTYTSADVYCHIRKPPSQQPQKQQQRLPFSRLQRKSTHYQDQEQQQDEVEVQHHKLTIVNAYTQYSWKPTIKTNLRGQRVKVNPVNYDAIRLAFRNIKQQFGGKRMGYPKIGAGLAGGNWEVIAKIIDEELRGEDHTLVLYQP